MSSHQLAEFSGLQITIHDIDDRRWIQALDVGRGLGYARPDNVLKVYSRHSDEFTVRDTCTVNLTVQGQYREVRLFSETGVVLLTMFANTSRAKDFRAWAKVVLAHELAANRDVQPSGLSRIEQHMEAMAGNMAQLTRISAQQAAKLEVTARYISLLELNQRGKVKVTPEVERKVFELKAEGMSQNDIARLLRISNGAVCLLLKGRYPRNSSYDAEPSKPTVEEILDRVANREAARVLGESDAS